MYAKIEDDVIVQIRPANEKGYVKVPDSSVCGMIKEGDKFVNPKAPPKSIQQQIDELESSITIRNLYGYNNGDQYAIKKIDETFAEIEQLRELRRKEL